MTTTLRLFYARAILLLAFVFLVLIALTGVAFAQEAATAPPEAPADMIGLIFSSLSAAAAALVVAILGVVTRHAPAWVVSIIDSLTTNDAVKWETLLDSALDRAEAYARGRFDPSKDRGNYVNAMVGFIHTFNPEIVKWLDKNQNGVLDLIEARFPAVTTHSHKRAPLAPVRGKAEAVQ